MKPGTGLAAPNYLNKICRYITIWPMADKGILKGKDES